MTMATSSFVLRCKTPQGIITISELDRTSSVKDLKESIMKLTDIQPNKMKIVMGFPPSPIEAESDNSKLYEAGIESGETLIIRIDNSLDTQVVPEVDKHTLSRSPKRRKQELPAMMKQGNELKNGVAGDMSGVKNGEEMGRAVTSENRDSIEKAKSGKKGFGKAVSDIKKKAVKALSETETQVGLGYGGAGESSVAGIMMRHDVPSNNSCLFSSIYFIMNGGTLDLTQCEELRQVIAYAVLQDPVKYNAAILGRENHDYGDWIQNRNHWGGAIELSILSEHFKLEICAIDVMSCQMLRFGDNNGYTKRCFVIYDGIHYDPLYLQGEEQMETIFSRNNNVVMELALELAREAQSSRQFTDTVNFNLKCNDCGQRLKGEKDAASHAIDTGHINFGELK